MDDLEGHYAKQHIQTQGRNNVCNPKQSRLTQREECLAGRKKRTGNFFVKWYESVKKDKERARDIA